MGNLSHLDALEAEAIYIIREVAAECEKPVMLYSIGKDSSVMLHLAMKAFYPEKPPFPFLHIDTTWKFKEMIKFRDDTAKKLGIEMLTYTNEEGVKQGINPFDHGSAYTDIMKTQALKQALNKYGFTAAFGGVFIYLLTLRCKSNKKECNYIQMYLIIKLVKYYFMFINIICK